MQAVYFIVSFVAIIVAFILFIVFLAKRFNSKVPQSVYNIVEKIIIAGILLGIVGMFQPWIHLGFRVGFHLLLFSTLTYIVWSHITPRATRYDEEEGVADISVGEPKAG
jgi:F0F1-type ATP synthase membrane subunit a